MADHASKIPIPEERQDLLSRGVAQASSYAQPKPISRAAAVSTYRRRSLMGTVPEIGFDQMNMDVSTRCTQHQSRRPANHHGSAPEESHLDQPSTPTTMLWIIHPSIHPLQRSPVHDSLNQQQQTPTTNRTSRSRTPEPACIAAGVCHGTSKTCLSRSTARCCHETIRSVPSCPSLQHLMLAPRAFPS